MKKIIKILLVNFLCAGLLGGIFYGIYCNYASQKNADLINLANYYEVSIKYVPYKELHGKAYESHTNKFNKDYTGFICNEGNTYYIYISKEYAIDYTILAHELGHFFGMKYYDDSSEEIANGIRSVILSEGDFIPKE